MSENNQLTFHVIYLPGAVCHLLPGVLSMHDNSNVRFRLIGNGVSPADDAVLQLLADRYQRFDYLRLPSQAILPHGLVLDLLLQAHRDTAAPFCFCDPDIFASAPFDTLLALSSEHDVVSSCKRVENVDATAETGFKGGSAVRAPDGLPLPTSYFCMYQAAALAAVQKDFAVGFVQYWRASQIPVAAAELLAKAKLEDCSVFDTGKLQGWLLAKRGASVHYQDHAALRHVGGLSGRFLADIDFGQPFVLDADGWNKAIPYEQEHDAHRSPQDRYRKRILVRYVTALLRNAVFDTPLPCHRGVPADIGQSLDALAATIAVTAKQHRRTLELAAQLTGP